MNPAPRSPGPATRLGPDLAACLLILLAALAWTAWRGQDVNWDLQNYHEYDPFALLHDRYARDVAPGGPQSFLNPLPYLPVYALRRLLPPLAAGLLVAVTQAVCLVLAWSIARTLDRRPAVAAAATLAAITGPVTLSELGTSFSDLLLATLPLASILLTLRPPKPGSRAGVRSNTLLAGLLTGLAIGMKPTSLFLMPPLLALAALRQPGSAAAARCALLCLGGVVAGALLSDGAWAWLLWRSYGSPMFPFLNTVFRSHAAALVDFGDPRFHFTGWRHALAIPFALAGGSAATGEVPIRDGRLALAACLALIRLLGFPSVAAGRRTDALAGLSAYLLLGLAGWLVLCPIERYASALEILAGLLAILLLARLPRRIWPPAACGAAALLLVATTRPAEYFHRPWSQAWQPRLPDGIPAHASYGLIAQPLSYWVVVPPRPDHAFGLTSTLMESGGALQRRLDRILHDAPDRIWLLNLEQPVDNQIRAEMSIHGLALAPPCLRAASMFWIDTVFCRGVVVGPRAEAASDLRPGDTVSFSRSGYGLIYEIAGFEPTEADGTWAVSHDSALAIHLDPAIRSSGAVLSLRLAGLGGAPLHRVTIAAGEGPPITVALAPPSYFAEPRLCIPRQASGDVLIRFRTPEIRSLAELGLSPEPRHLSFRLFDMSMRAARPGECR